MAPNLDEERGAEEIQSKMEILSEKFKQILKSNGILDEVSEVTIKTDGLQGEGFASEAQYVTVKFVDTGKKPLNLFVKAQTDNQRYAMGQHSVADNPSHTEFLDEMKAFEKEARFLSDYCTAAREMCKLKGRPDFLDFYPKCYYGDAKMIVMENLVLDKGYVLKSKEERQNFEDAKFALKTLAKHHAIGHVMISENGGPKAFFQKFPNLDCEAFDKTIILNMLGGMMNNGLASNLKILEKNSIPGAKEAADILRQFEGKPVSILLELLKIPDDSNKFLTLGHGDYWNNNMMFLMDSVTKKNVHHVAIDLQVTRYNTPALDLTYYFFTSVQPHVRRSHLLELLTLYKDTLNKTCEDFGHPINLTLDQIFNEFRNKVGYGYWFGFMMNVGPGAALFKDMDISTLKVEEWPAVMNQLINKWIDENPQRGKETAEELVKLVREYEQLKI